MSVNDVTQLIEEGALASQWVERAPFGAISSRESFDVIVIGAGQAGLSVGYHLARSGARFLILDANERVGDTWRNRWDSLRLFTPAKFDGLDGMPFPAPRNYFPTKDEMANYLEAYARHFRLPVRSGVRVERLFRRGSRYVIEAGTLELEAGQVVVAMAKYQHPKVPPFAADLSSDIVQLHSSDYRNLRQLRPGGVLLAGAGNSGADIAVETSRGGHKTWLAGRDTGEIPFRPERFHVLTVKTRPGRKVRPSVLKKGGPLIRVKRRDLAAAGVERVPRVVGVRGGQPLLETGQTLAVNNVIWSCGFDPGFDWIDLPVFSADGESRHCSGIVESQPGLYFVGLPFLHAMSSSMIHGVGRDAARVAYAIKLRLDTASVASATALG